MWCFNPCFNGSGVKTRNLNRDGRLIFTGFNPCFNGSGVKTKKIWNLPCIPSVCFNPCFNGSGVKTVIIEFRLAGYNVVSILVLMEVVLRLEKVTTELGFPVPFQSLF